MTKKKFIKPFAILAAVFLGSLEMGWRFFNMVVCCKRGGRKKERKKWFELSHIRDNHPRNGYAKEYDESRAWCETQKMQDCYIQSVDGLKLHGFYLPAEHAKRFVILSHGYRGSRFGSLSFMAKYLHEHQCDVLFIEHRCCGDSEGKYITFGAKEQWDVQQNGSPLGRSLSFVRVIAACIPLRGEGVATGASDPHEICPIFRRTRPPAYARLARSGPRRRSAMADSFIFGEASKAWDIDLVVSSHDHGGQVVIPFLGGFYGGDQGYFPEYIHGLYNKDKMKILISSGLGSNKQKLPRFNNVPEVMVVNLSN